MQRNPELDVLAEQGGIVFDHAMDYLPRIDVKPGMGHNGGPEMGSRYGAIDRRKLEMAMDAFMAFDAPTYQQPGLITSPNGGIPAFLTTYLDPKLIEALLTPLKSEEIYGVTKKCDWTTQTTMFVMIEMTGEVSAYGDWNADGVSGTNWNYPQRQSFLFQTITQWGDLQMDRAALGRVDLAARLNLSSANSLNRFANLMNFFGVANLQLYGGLNDPNLAPALTPALKAAGGTGWQNALPTEILADVQAAYAQLQSYTYGSPGNVELTTRMTLALSPTSEVFLVNQNQYGMVARDMLKVAFPNLMIKTAPEYQSGTTYSFQLIVDEWFDGQRTCEAAFTEKMRAHRIIPDMSAFKQKKTAGGWGTIIYRPMGIVAMAGI